MSLSNFIPQIWAGSIQSNLNKSLVYAQPGVVNTDYEGDISQWGDRVHINSIGRVNVRDYDPATGLADPDTLDSGQLSLVIDQQKEFNFMVGDIDMAQTKPKVMSEATAEAAYALADVADKFVAGLYTGAGKAIGSDASPQTVVARNPASGELTAYDALVDLSTLLSKKSTKTIDGGVTVEIGGAPEANRWVVVDPDFYGLLRKDERFVHATSSGDQVIRNGEIGQAAGFRVLMSNNVPTQPSPDGGTTPGNKKVIAGHAMGWSWAEQINKTEAYRPDKFFSDALRGLHLYGAKVVRPEALAVLSVATA